MPFWRKKTIPDPCQKQACDIQTCLQAKNYDESACRKFIEALEKCCERNVGRESVCCDGIKTPDTKS
ncbi:Cx9C motif-containing protein 4 [Mizuhopecten yessoensis]|uniref:Cx9C motif-containing protein 4 n=1 Tax=Mizuhopecten yessoensis TaxID=6573 RepID=A0A210PQQ6_MIZYE|nr:Cx9C motif-containing protein 4 [Mizuhopecten yessoensis]